MAKITVHGGPTIAGITGASWSDNDEPDTWPASPDASTSVELEPAEQPMAEVSVDGVDQGPGEVDETLGGPFKPLPEAVEGDTAEHVSEPDYENWTVAQLREVLANRELPVSGTKAELITRLRTHDEP